MNHIIWLIGQTCVGKTEFTESIRRSTQESFDAPYHLGKTPHIMNVGKECRQLWPTHAFVEDANSVTPQFTEEFVRKTVEDWIDNITKHNSDCVLIVDSVPRSNDQLDWCGRLESKFSLSPLYVFATCVETVWKQRIKKRNVDDDAAHLIQRRLLDEPALILKVLAQCMNTGRPLVHVDLSDGGILAADQIRDILVESRPRQDDNSKFKRDFGSIWAMHSALNDHSLGRYGCSTALLANHVRGGQSRPADLPATWARRFSRKAIVELEELIEELPDEWWTEDRVDFEKAREELIDVFHFVLSCGMALGLTADSFVETYYAKAQKNLDRWNSGTYKKRNLPGDFQETT